jgi:PAS domain S-box-containing protein
MNVHVLSFAERYGMAAGLSTGVGLVAMVTGEASCLLAPVVVAGLRGDRGPALLSIAATIAFALLLFARGPLVHLADGGAVHFAVFVATALLIGVLLAARMPDRVVRRQEHEAKRIVDSMPGFGWSTDAKGNFRYLSPSIFDYTGIRCDDPETTSFAGAIVLHPDEADRIVRHWVHCLETGEPYDVEQRMRRFDGEYRWFRAVAQPSRDAAGRITGWYGLTYDINGRRKAEEELRKSRAELESIVESIPGMIAAADARGRHAYANRRLLDYIGHDLSPDVDLPWLDIVHPDDREAVLAARTRCVATGEPLEVVYRRRRRDGVYRWFRVRVEPARDKSGRIIRWYSLLVDVHEEQLAQQALRDSEQRLRLLTDTIPALVWCATSTGDAFYLNKRLLDYSGLRPEEADQARSRLIHPDDIPLLVRAWEECLASGDSFRMVYRLRRADGAYRWHEGRAEPWRDETGAIAQWYGVNVDIDDRLRAEQALRAVQARFQRAAQFAGLAELSASIAHEVNQPLAAVVTNSHACRRWLSAEPPNLQRAQAAAERTIRDANAAAAVVSRVRALFKQTQQAKAPVDLNEVITEVCDLLADDISGREIRIDTSLEEGLPRVLADRVQLQQVLVNLIRNGMEAMDGIEAPKVLAIRSQRDEDGMVAVEIRDHGHGIADPESVFEPFVTTKPDGMGMGLAICRSIVEAHDGRIRVTASQPAGTVFQVVLPAHATVSVAAEPPS